MLHPKDIYEEVSEELAEKDCWCHTCSQFIRKGYAVVIHEEYNFCSFDKNYKCFDDYTTDVYSSQFDNYLMEDR